jgi:ABC-type multidrug transport system ATPase subunit
MHIYLDKVSKKFNRQLVFRELTYHFQSGQRYAITGANGSGKSTLLQVIINKIPPSKGKISYKSASGKAISADDVFEEFSIATTAMTLIEEFKLEEMINFHFKFKKPISNIFKTEIPALLGLEKETKKYIGNFSSGMKQRLKIGLAVLSESSLLILDEPGANLDVNAKKWYQSLLKNHLKDRTVIIASNESEDYVLCENHLSLESFKN